MARFTNRDPRTGRYSVSTENTPVDAKFPTWKSLDVSASAGDFAYELVPGATNVVSSPAVPAVTDKPEAEPSRTRIRTQATGLRGAYSRTDQRLLERAQVGTDPLPGTQTGDK